MKSNLNSIVFSDIFLYDNFSSLVKSLSYTVFKLFTLTSSKLKSMKRIYNKTLHTIFLDPYNFQRIFVLFLWDILVELKSQITHKIKNIQPRLRRTIVYAAVL